MRQLNSSVGNSTGQVVKVAPERFGMGKSGITPSIKTKSIFQYLKFIPLSLQIKRQFSLSSPVMYCLFLIAIDNTNKINSTASRLSTLLYGDRSGIRGVRFRLSNLIQKDLIYKEGNCYYLTDKAIQAISNIEL